MGFSRLYGRDLQHWSPPYQTNSNGNLVSHAVFLKRFILFDDVDDSGDDGGDDGGDDDDDGGGGYDSERRGFGLRTY